MSDAYEWESLLTLPQLRAVVTVARVGTFSGAAGVLRTSQPAVSRAVAAVEERLGVELFARSTRRVVLTPAGEDFVERAERALAEVRAAASAARRPGTVPRRSLAIACLLSVAQGYLAGTLARVAPPGGGTRVRCIEALQSGIEDEVLARRVDVGIADLDALPDGVTARPLWSEPAHVCLPPGHPRAGQPQVTLDQLADDDIVAFPRQARFRAGVDRALAVAGQLRPPRLVVQHFGTAFDLVAAGFGITIVPACVVPAVPPGVATPRLLDPSLHRTVGAIWPPGTPPPALAEHFITTLVELVTANPLIAPARPAAPAAPA